jgi:hypothetical protein
MATAKTCDGTCRALELFAKREMSHSNALALTKTAKLATQLATRNFLNRASESTKAAEVAAT